MDVADLHKWVAAYNWDDGLAPMWAIADWPRTEYATALLIFWRLGGPDLEGDAASVNAEAARLLTLVRGRLLGGFYPRGASRFDPAAELSQVQLYRFRNVGVPEALLAACNPDDEPQVSA